MRSASSLGGQRACAGERAVEAELVAHHDERGVQRRADLVDGAENERLELRAVDGGGLFDCCHVICLLVGFVDRTEQGRFASHQVGT